MSQKWRPIEVLSALMRIGYRDKPGRGDHVRLFKSLTGHPDGPVTLQAGLDTGVSPCSKKDIGYIRRSTKLQDDTMWTAALNKKLAREEYDAHLRSIPRSELVPPAWKHIVEREEPPDPKKPKGG